MLEKDSSTDDYTWLLKKQKKLGSQPKHQLLLTEDTDPYGSPKQRRSGLHEERKSGEANPYRTNTMKRDKMRKSSTPDKRKKKKINLFERNNVDELVDQNTIHIEDTDQDDEPEENLLLRSANLKQQSQNASKSLHNYRDALAVNNDSEEEGETVKDTDAAEE